MSGHQPCCVEEFCLGQLSNLEQLEGPWVELMGTGDPGCIATALRLFHCHLLMTITQLGPAMVVSEVQDLRRSDPAATQALL